MTVILADSPSDTLCCHCHHWLSHHADGKCLYEPTWFDESRCIQCKQAITGLVFIGYRYDTLVVLDYACIGAITRLMDKPSASIQECIDWISVP